MLVITRREGETLSIHLEDGRQITVMVARIRDDRVRVGIEAPRTIQVHRPGWERLAPKTEVAA